MPGIPDHVSILGGGPGVGNWCRNRVTRWGSDTGVRHVRKPESLRADDLIEERINNGVEAPAEEYVVVTSDTYEIGQPEFEAFVGDLAGEIGALEDVAGVATYYQTDAPTMVAEDNHGTMLLVTLAGEPEDAVDNSVDFLALIEEESQATPGFEVRTAGGASINHAFNTAAEDTLQRGELIGIAVAIVVLVVVFGALVAAGLPLILALVSIVTTLGVTAIVGQFTDLSFFVVNMIFMIGLAVGIDYVLFIVARYREEREAGREKIEAIVRTGETSSKAILFSGLTVVTALAGLLIVPDTIFFSLGMGAILVVIASLFMTMTLLPAVLSLLGDRINWGRPPVIGYGRRSTSTGSRKEGVWAKTARLVMRRPVVSVVLSAGLLVALGSFALTIELGSTGITSLPADEPSVQAYMALKEEFPGGDLEPATIVIDAADVNSDNVQTAVDALLADLADDNIFGTPEMETASDNTLLVIDVPVHADAQSNVAIDAVNRIRDTYLPAHFSSDGALVTGSTASTIDYTDLMLSYMPWVFALVLSITFVLLLLAFRSLVVPAKAILMNLLSVFAAYGLVTIVFQHGVGASLFGFKTVDRIDNWIPLFLFAVLFGLSMDYHIFLLSRIKERFDETGDNTAAVADGLRSTASIISGAALIMVGVFGGFALGYLSSFQQMGFGLAAAVVIDATIVRSVLVPSSMALLGKRNWYFPNWLEWLPKINVEGSRELPEPVGAMGD
ncbi:MAG: MMPL family transporter [Thermomicrobiales bacterium]